MEEKIETVSTEVVETTTPAPAPEKPEKPKKSKGLIATTIIMTIIAIAGIAFGVYGMFFDGKASCEINCTENSSTQTGQTEQEPTETYTAPTAAEVATLLDNKYSLKEKNRVFAPAMYSFIDNLDYTAKLIFTLQATEDQQDEILVSNEDLYVIKTISYDDLNNQFKKYFGNQQNIEKKDYELMIYKLVKMTYDASSGLFSIKYPTGLGGTSPFERLIKVNEVVGTEDGFYALATAVTVNMTDAEAIDEVIDSLSLYKFNFITEDGEYKLISVEKF